MSDETVAVIAITVLVLLAIALGLTRYRGRRATRAMSPQLPVASVAEQGALSDDEVVLVPLPNRHRDALLVGTSDALALLDASGVTDRGWQHGPGQLAQLVRSGMALGGGEATRRAQHGVDSGRIVALSEETMKHLDAGTPVYDKAKNMLGVVSGDKGRIRHVMRLDKTGAQAVVASNAATLAMTAAVSQQLAAIEQQLADIGATLETMVRENDAKRLANVVATNQALMGIADAVRRRGITATDMTKLAALDLPVITNQLEAEFKFADLLGGERDRLSRADRVRRLEEIASNERLEYWLAVRIQADLAQTRLDLLNLQWEATQHPETTSDLSERTRKTIDARQARLHELGDALQDLTDASSRTKLDPVRQLARRRLSRENRVMRELLATHGDVFLAPDEHPYAVLATGSTAARSSPERPRPPELKRG